jgi:endonuclease/exonuclease/phosphatase family metal-dependent hydrolase
LWWLFGKISVASGDMRTRYSSLPPALLLLCLSACASAAARTGEPLRVLVYNIHAGKDAAGTGNLDRVAEIVRSSRSDIVMLQEVDNRTRRSGGVDQLSRLRELTGFHGVFGKTIDYDGGEYGIGILSRWPITSWRLIQLPVEIADSAARARYEARGALAATIADPSGNIRVVNTHLDASRSDSNRVQQANALIFFANAQRDSGFTILGGDLNSEPTSRVAELFATNGWKDLYNDCGSANGFSFPANEPVKRIDYLYIKGRMSCKSAAVLDTQASDHRPVLFEVIRTGRD